MPSSLRMKRINDRMKQILSTVLLGKIEDPRLSGVMVTDVRVDRELDFANIYVSAIEGMERSKEIMDALQHAKGYLRYEISQEIDLRVTPKLRFFWDPTPEKAARIDDLLNELRQEEQPSQDDESDKEFDDETFYEDEDEIEYEDDEEDE
ncbi:MAG: 30S ribosome-binding factor RbfA [Anaerolineaceae bacterium]|nr:30S ribosome-binding factor RbfA [Anaerolineaceae bacterium]MDD4043175.1 30S ribosome-binding factor RbfA [Anaerolineaceae bacterium]MDD4578636.1 30S ribosome-binding factor RbfA [Anaerolineaceae bacterium]